MAQVDINIRKKKSIIDLALNTCLQEIASKNVKNGTANVIDPAFKSLITGQIKVFLFSGHDKTSSSIYYVFHLLSEHPSELHRLRASHDTIFTTDVAAAASLISRDPHLVNKLPFTLAVTLVKLDTMLSPKRKILPNRWVLKKGSSGCVRSMVRS